MCTSHSLDRKDKQFSIIFLRLTERVIVTTLLPVTSVRKKPHPGLARPPRLRSQNSQIHKFLSPFDYTLRSPGRTQPRSSNTYPPTPSSLRCQSFPRQLP